MEITPKDLHKVKSDNTRVTRPLFIERIEYKPKQGEYFVTVNGKKTLVKPTTVSSDNRSSYQKKEDDKNSEFWRKQYERADRTEKGLKNLSTFINLFSPSTYIGPIFNNNGKSYVDNVITGARTGNEEADAFVDIFTPFAAGGTKSLVTNTIKLGNSVYYSNKPIGQYLRFVGGKFKYGFDARLPDLIRRTKTPMPKKFLLRRNSPIRVSPIENRFRFKSTGQPSPVITNFTTDLPVIPNNGGSWEGFDINIINGNLLLGKNVISTRPMDTFTYGDNIIVPRKAIKIISSKKGTVPEELLMQQFMKTYRRPTLKDYLYMDYVFLPQYSSDVITNTPLSLENISTHPLGKYFSDGDMRPRLDLPWKNVMYNIAPTIEEEFRDNLGIVLRSELYK